VIHEHIEKESEARNPILVKYLKKVREMEKHFKGYTVQHISRNDNNEADKLAKVAAQKQAIPPDVFFEIIKEPSIKDPKPKTVNSTETHDWRAEIMAYLRGYYEPQDELEKNAKTKGKGLCYSGWRTLQVRNHRTMAKVHNLRKGCGTSQRTIVDFVVHT
jgi:hypothetical protein